MVILDSILFWTVVSSIAAVVAALVAVLTVWTNRHKKKEEKLEALGKLKQSRDELCVAMNVGEINMLLNNAIMLCDERNSDSRSLNGVWNQLQPILKEVKSKWNSLELQLTSSGNDKLSEQLAAVIQEYLFCFRDVETVIAVLRCDKVEDVEGLVLSENSEEMKGIMEATKPLYTDVYEFVKQVISLRFLDLGIPDYAAKVRQLWDDESKYEYNLNTRLFAVMGDPVMQNALGDYYYEQKQYKKAFAWYKKAAERDLAEAQFSLGVCYKNGYGVEIDDREAFQWYKRAAEQGFAEAQLSLGVCYKNGNGVEKDEREAVKWYKRAAEQDLALAQFYLGLCYADGCGVEKDEREAFKWYKRAAEQDVAEAQSNLGVCYSNGCGVEKDEREAFKWYKRAAEQDLAEGQFNLGVCFEKGEGVKKDQREAFEWYKRAAEQDLPKAQYNLGVYYLKGDVVEKDEREALIWLKKAAEQGYPHAQLVLGECYENGEVCDQDYNKAFYWYRKATESEEDIEVYSWAMYKIGYMYEHGTIGLGNMGTAVGYYEIAAQYGHYRAQCKLGYCYETGMGGKEVDIEKAKYWYGEAAKQGDEEAIASLARLNKS